MKTLGDHAAKLSSQIEALDRKLDAAIDDVRVMEMDPISAGRHARRLKSVAISKAVLVDAMTSCVSTIDYAGDVDEGGD